MSLWSVLQGIGSQVNPFDNGKTYSTYNPPKKTVQAPQVQTPQVVQPTNVFNQPSPVGFGTLQTPNRVSVPPLNQPSNAETALRSAGATGTSFAGGLASLFKSLVSAPTLAYNATNLIGLGAAKLTGNEVAAQNASQRIQDNKAANLYNELVNPVTSRLTSFEQGTDKVARNIAPWQTDAQKNAAKVLANLIPFAPGASAASKASRAARAAEETQAIEAARLANTTNIPVRQVTTIPVREASSIPVTDVTPNAVSVPVRNTNVPKPLIQDVSGGEPFTTPNAMIKQNAIEQSAKNLADRFDSQAYPSNLIQDVTPRTSTPYSLSPTDVATSQQKIIDDYAKMLKGLGEGNGVAINRETGARISNNVRSAANKGKRMTKADWQAEAESQLKAGKAEPGTQQAFNDSANPDLQSLINKGEQVDAPVGKPIQVKQVNSIDVNKVDNLPANLPETPGKVRVTTSKSPVATQSEAIAAQTPASLPKVGTIMPDGTKVTKRMVQSARNQNKLATKLANTKADTQAVIDNMPSRGNAPSGAILDKNYQAPATNSGFAPTGKFRKGVNGNVSEVASREAEAARAKTAMQDKSANDLINELSDKTEYTQADVSNIEEAKNTLMQSSEGRNSDAFKVLDAMHKAAGSARGKALRLFNIVYRRTASGNQLTNKWFNKLSKIVDTNKISDEALSSVKKANDKFAAIRDKEVMLDERFRQTGSRADSIAWKSAHDELTRADQASKDLEATFAKTILKGDKSEQAAKVLSDLQKEADLGSMDFVTANQLSGLATAGRNIIGTEMATAEHRFTMPNVRAKITNKIFGENVGGWNREGARMGRKEGFTISVDRAKARADYGGKNPINIVKNWTTTINQGGDSAMYSQARSKLFAHYENTYKAQGYTGEELKMRVQHAAIKDPDNFAEIYLNQAKQSSGLSGVYQKTRGQFEKNIADYIGSKFEHAGLSAGKAAATGKAISRLTFGYPTATGNFLYQSAKRLSLGTMSIPEIAIKLAKGDKIGAAMAFDNALKEAGSGAAVWVAGGALGSAGLISGFYPTDKATQQNWQDEGKSELSMRINGAWYPIPTTFGMFGLPLIAAATFQQGGIKGLMDAFGNRKNFSKLLPTDQIHGVLEILGGNSTNNQDKSFTASTIRSFIPVGSFLNQIMTGLDKTANDTTTRSFWKNVFDQVSSGLPIANGIANAPDKVSSDGTPISNPNLLQKITGATSAVQPQGMQQVNDAQNQANDTYKQLNDLGVIQNKSLMGLVDKKIAAQITRGQDLSPKELKSVQDAITKGITTGITAAGDSNWRENGDYTTDRIARQVKLQILEADPMAKKSDIAGLKTQIARDDVLEKNKIAYDDLKLYQNTTQNEWKAMGDSTNDAYDPETYQKLMSLDKLFTDAAGSYNTDPTKAKYKASSTSSKKGGSGFGTLNLNSSSSAPRVRQYQTANMSGTGNIPVINVTHPNIVHKISVTNK